MNTLSPKSSLIKTLLISSLLIMPTVQAAVDDAIVDTTIKAAKSVDKILNKTKIGVVEHKGDNKSSAKSSIEAPAKSTLVDPSNNNNSDHEVWVYSVDINLTNDANHNGYYNRLVVDFDADTHYDHIDVYATLSLTAPNGITTEYYTTNDFSLYGESTSDTHQVDTLLTDNWITDGYDLSIALYDAHSHELVAYVDKYDAPQMGYLTLESQDYEYTAEQYLSVFSSNLWLQNDEDGDGYYHSFNIDLDIDVNYGSKDVYAEIYISNDSYNWQSLYTSDHFFITENDTADTKHWEFDLLSGQAPGHYFIKVVIIDANSHYTLLEMQPEDYSALYAVPLEDFSYEVSSPVNVPSPVNTPSSISHERGGNMGGPVVLLLLMLLILARRTMITVPAKQ